MSNPYTAMTIAKWFIAWANAEEADLSNLKLQKLLYYAQGWSLAKTGKPLFADPIQAWSHGPVVPEVYHAFKQFGSADVKLDDADPFEWADVDESTAGLLLRVWNTYGEYGAWRLANMTHDEAPWKNQFQSDSQDPAIPLAALKTFFGQLPQTA